MADVLLLLALSFGRMLAAYAISLILAFVLGYYMARVPIIERMLVPVLDMLQSVPILVFFPPVIYLFINHTPPWMGAELAAIFLIITSMVWNMIFSVYEGFISLNKSMGDVAKMFRVNEFDKFFKLYLPHISVGLISNSLASWGSGWFFLIATEVISVGHDTFALNGIGSYIMTSAKDGDIAGIVTGVLLVSSLIVLLDILVWRPLMNMTAKYIQGKRGALMYDRMLDAAPKSGINVSVILRKAAKWIDENAIGPLSVAARGQMVNKAIIVVKDAIKYIIIIGTVGIFLGFVYVSAMILPSVTAKDVADVASAFIYTGIRIIAALVMSMAWVVPAVYLLTRNKKVEETLIRYAEIMSSIPVSAIFPAAILILLSLSNGNLEAVALIFLMAGMQWYLFFNIYGGVKSMPAYVYGIKDMFLVRDRTFMAKVVMPFMMPFVLIGMIAALGSGWNTSILAEYVVLGDAKLEVWGLGSMIQHALADGNVKVMYLCAMALVLTIPVINITLWRPLMKGASKKRGQLA